MSATDIAASKPPYPTAAPPGAPVSPLRSAETFDAYCTQVQKRLSVHAAQRIHFLQAAYDRLGLLLQAAHDMEDTALTQELIQHRNAAKELLESLRRLPSSVSSAVSSVETPPSAHPIHAPHAASVEETPMRSPALSRIGPLSAPPVPTYAPSGELIPPQPPMPRPPP